MIAPHTEWVDMMLEAHGAGPVGDFDARVVAALADGCALAVGKCATGTMPIQASFTGLVYAFALLGGDAALTAIEGMRDRMAELAGPTRPISVVR